MKSRTPIIGIIFVTMIALMACESATLTPGPVAYNVNPPMVTSAALQPTVEQAQVDMYLDAVRAERMQLEARSTLEALSAYQTATAQAVHATATQQAWLGTATAEVHQTTATAVAWQATTDALYAQGTATAQAAAQNATGTAAAQSAQATATVQVAQATATIEAVLFQQRATETAVAWASQATATGVAWVAQATATAEVVNSMATIQAASAESARLATERERITHPVLAYGPWVLLGMVSVLLLWIGYRFSKVMEMRARVMKMGPHEREIILLDDKVLQPNRGHYPVLDYVQPVAASLEDQRMTTARAQAVELMRASHTPVTTKESLPQGSRSSRAPRLSPSEAVRRTMHADQQTGAPGLHDVRMLRRLDQAEKAGYIPPSLVDALTEDWERLKDG